MNEKIEIDVEIKKITEMAILADDGYTEHWIPKSLIEEDVEDAEVDETITITIPEWFAEKEGLA